MKEFIIIAFYTKNTPYEREVLGLIKSCIDFNIEVHAQAFENQGEWVRNAALKPKFLLDMMDKFPNKNLVYLDADARIRQYPILFDSLDCDLALHLRDRGEGRKELLSGTIFIAPTKNAKCIIEAWVQAQQDQPQAWDQRVLEVLLKDWKDPYVFIDLPPSYCQIFDSMKVVGDPIIEHMQASRRFKNLVLTGEKVTIPKIVDNCRIYHHSGYYWLLRPNKKVEALLDEKCLRQPGTLAWAPRPKSDIRIADLQPFFFNKACYIVGKGPSLDHLTSDDFPEQNIPIIAINEAIHKVEDLNLPNSSFGLQQDAKLRDTCRPRNSYLFVEEKAANYYLDVDNIYLFQNSELGLSRNSLSVIAAIALLKLLGCISLKFLCFDACISGQLGYAKCIGYESTNGGLPERFLSHRNKILSVTEDVPVEWIPVNEKTTASS